MKAALNGGVGGNGLKPIVSLAETRAAALAAYETVRHSGRHAG